MAPPKKPGPRFEGWLDRQIRQARERGEFDDLAGAGQPLADLGKPYDEMWWVKRKLRDEKLSYLPPSLALRKEAHEAVHGTTMARTEEELRDRLGAINERIRDAIRTGIRGPDLNLVPLDIERFVREWRTRQS